MSVVGFKAERKARIGIMGEFSAGKSTLCNILLSNSNLPQKVTATRLSPVWLTQGPGQDMRVLTDGTEEPTSVEQIGEVPIEGTRYIRVHNDADVLENCDFVDFPGISDPNMDAEVWERVLGDMDAIIWLTHSTQAWRQTEASVWETVPEAVREKSILLLTRFDKIVGESDRARVVARITRETEGLFDKIFPVSLLQASQADEEEAWAESGAADLMDHIAGMIARLTSLEADRTPAHEPAHLDETSNAQATPRDEMRAFEGAVQMAAPEKAPAPVAHAADLSNRIIPRRVKPTGTLRRSARPTAEVVGAGI
ncbi:MAG: dynamin family protein [Pseudomonadota bacterium]